MKTPEVGEWHGSNFCVVNIEDGKLSAYCTWSTVNLLQTPYIMAVIGKLGEFGLHEEVTSYVLRLKHYFKANQIRTRIKCLC
ncbi:hypothetical protein PR048_016147 [Dryococelus australis]|uniref:Uncharacterized protein n=1 Tax=Dryococelus australis TaxID=614101 RepID=A0ABQ9HJC2_9NEOP|nr:hypothetical protein PR048_016147 [Dryococelus australis]